MRPASRYSHRPMNAGLSRLLASVFSAKARPSTAQPNASIVMLITNSTPDTGSPDTRLTARAMPVAPPVISPEGTRNSTTVSEYSALPSRMIRLFQMVCWRWDTGFMVKRTPPRGERSDQADSLPFYFNVHCTRKRKKNPPLPRSRREKNERLYFPLRKRTWWKTVRRRTDQGKKGAALRLRLSERSGLYSGCSHSTSAGGSWNTGRVVSGAGSAGRLFM